MKKIITTTILTALASSNLFAQNVGIGTSAPNSSSKLEISSTNSGLLIPRVALTALNAAGPITAPATSLLVYNTATAGVAPNNVTPGYYYWTGTTWSRLLNSTSSDWTLLGNAGTVAATNFIGTTDAVDFVTRTNNLERMRVLASGGIQVTSPNFNANAINPAIDVQGAWIRLGDALGNQTFTNGMGIKFHDSGVNHASMQYISSSNFINFGTSGGNGNALALDLAATPALAIDLSNRRIGIGTNAPAEAIHAIGNIRSSTLGGVGSRLVASDVNGTLTNIATGTNGQVLTLVAGVPAWATSATTAWNLTGNAGTNAATNFIGTTDAVAFSVRTNNIEHFRITSAGAANIWSGGNYAVPNGYMAAGSLTIGNTNTNFGGGSGWNTNTTGLMLEALDNTEISAHDYGTRLVSLSYYEGAANRIHIGRDMGWGTISTISLNGNVGVGIVAPTQKFDVQGGNARINNAFIGDVGHGATWAGFANSSSATTTGYALLQSTTGDYTLINKQNSGTGYIGFRVGNIDQAVITNAGNMGIGTTAPAYKLDVNGTIRAIDIFAAGGQNLIIGDDTYFSDIDVPNRLGLISTSNANVGELKLGNSATNPVLSGNPGYLSIDQEIRLQGNSNILKRGITPVIWTDQFDSGLAGVYTGNSESEEGGFWVNGNYAMILSPGDNDLVKFVDEDYLDNTGSAYDNNAMRARVDGNGQYFQISDARSKTNIQPIQNSLEKLLAINGYTYQFTLLDSEKAKGQQATTTTGVLAQELEKVLPEAVSNYDGNYMVNYAALTPLLIEAIQEQQTMIENQQKLIEEQMKMLQELKEKVDPLEQK